MAHQPLTEYRVDVPAQIELLDTEQKSFSACPIVTSIFGLLCCPLFGTLSAIFAVMGYVEHRTRQYARARYYNKPAYAFGITSIVLGCLFLLLFVIALTLAFQQMRKVTHQSHSNGYYGN